MSVLSQQEPADVLEYFEQICRIPHGSGNTKEISDFCVSFAKEHDLRYIQDKNNNVILFKDGTEGYEQSSPVMIQGHLDMVCEQEPDSSIDFATDGLALQVDGDFISAGGTTLGGDDGIAIAYALALLASDDIPHPPLEVVFTVDEEVGMLGAAALDCSALKSRVMLNLDSEDEGYLLVSCAGGVCAICHLPVQRHEEKGTAITLAVRGLTGGHSGVEIDKGRGNANQLLGRLLYELKQETSFSLVSVNGGLKDNAIPREATAKILVDTETVQAVQEFAAKWHNILIKEYQATDPALQVRTENEESITVQTMDAASSARVICALLNLPGGVQRMSHAIEGLVQTSLNLGILVTKSDEVTMSYSVRSSVETEKRALLRRLESLTEYLGGTVECLGDYPAWEYNPHSALRELMIAVFEEQYGHKPVVQALHAGVECGLFSGKLPGLDCVSFGPDILDIHTTSERIRISSIQRVWTYIKEVLKRLH